MSTVRRILTTTALCFAALGLSSCVLETHQRVLDTARVYDGIIELPDTVYQVGSRYFVQGVQTSLRRSHRELVDCPFMRGVITAPEHTGGYTVLPDAPRRTVYREFRMRDGFKPFDKTLYALYPAGHSSTPPDDSAPVWPGGSEYERDGYHPFRNEKGQVIAWYKYIIEFPNHREYRGPWIDKLPAGARPVWPAKEPSADHAVLQGEKSIHYYEVSDRSEARVDKGRALYAYPLAGICWLVPDAVATVAMHVPFLPVFIWRGLRRCLIEK